MRVLVAPSFNEKLALMDARGKSSLSRLVSVLRSIGSIPISGKESGLEFRFLKNDILAIRFDGCSVYASAGSDGDGKYLLLLDIVSEYSAEQSTGSFSSAKNPTQNPSVDPRRNAAIDPRRNAAIDPRRNAAIDPRRNAAIDPRRNFAIDPRRNFAIDPRRNFAIDPQRNFAIDPLRNFAIDPRRNRFYGGPYIYDSQFQQEGFVVRANERILLLFNLSAKFWRYGVKTDQGNINVFDLSGSWVEFLHEPMESFWLRFQISGQWIGIIV